MSAENLFTTSRIENVNQIIAELYDDSILLEKRMESFFLNLNNIVFFEKEQCYYQCLQDMYSMGVGSDSSDGYAPDVCSSDLRPIGSILVLKIRLQKMYIIVMIFQ